MAEFLKVSTKAATITGAVLGLLCALFSAGVTGMMGSQYAGATMMGYVYQSFGLVAIVYGIVIGAIIGALIAAIYNWALSMK